MRENDVKSKRFGYDINEIIKNIYAEGELEESGYVQKFGNSEFLQKAPNYYNLDVIISVGYRVKSHQGTQPNEVSSTKLISYLGNPAPKRIHRKRLYPER